MTVIYAETHELVLATVVFRTPYVVFRSGDAAVGSKEKGNRPAFG